MLKQTPNRKNRSLASVAAGLCAAPLLIGPGSVQAQVAAAPAAPPAPPPPKPWENKITAGVTLSRGNSDSFMATAGIESKRKWEHDELAGYGTFGYGETTSKNTDPEVTTKSDDYLTAGLQWNHLFTPRFYAGLKGDYRHDDVADLEYRFTVSPLAGYYLIKTDRDTLNVEAGPGYVWEKLGGKGDEYFTLRFVEKYEHKFSDKARLWQMVEYLPKVEDWANKYIINAELGIETAISKAISLRVVAMDTYDSQPASDREQNDFKLIAGLTYTFRL